MSTTLGGHLVNFSHCAKEWQKLRQLESPLLSKKFLQGLDNGQEVLSSFTFSAYLAQARQFFAAADVSPLQIRPLLLYYGVMQFAKACILARMPQRAARLEAQKHGLATLRRKRPTPYWDQTVWIQPNGVFMEWLRATQPADPALIDAHLLHKQPMPVRALWACLPDISDILDGLAIGARCAPIKGFAEQHERLITLEIPRTLATHAGLTSAECERLVAQGLPDHYTARFVWQNADHAQNVQSEEDKDPTIEEILLAHPLACLPRQSGLWFFISPLPVAVVQEISLPEPFIHFALLFHLSMLLRYEGEVWTELVGDGTTLEALLIEHLCDLVTQTLPAYIVKLLL